jgi:hypothetical protein
LPPLRDVSAGRDQERLANVAGAVVKALRKSVEEIAKGLGVGLRRIERRPLRRLARGL